MGSIASAIQQHCNNKMILISCSSSLGQMFRGCCYKSCVIDAMRHCIYQHPRKWWGMLQWPTKNSCINLALVAASNKCNNSRSCSRSRRLHTLLTRHWNVLRGKASPHGRNASRRHSRRLAACTSAWGGANHVIWSACLRVHSYMQTKTLKRFKRLLYI